VVDKATHSFLAQNVPKSMATDLRLTSWLDLGEWPPEKKQRKGVGRRGKGYWRGRLRGSGKGRMGNLFQAFAGNRL